MSSKQNKCQICNSTDTKTLHTEIYDGDTYEYSICKKCSFVFQTNRYDKEKYLNLPCQFPKDYIKHSKNRGKYIYDFCSNYLSNGLKILDVGCYRGGVMKTIGKLTKSSEVYGCDVPFKEKPLKGTNITYGEFDKIKFDDKYDFVVMSHILEHFLDLRKSLRKLKKVMHSDTITYIEVPSLDYLKVRISFEFCPEHLSYFTLHSLSNLLLSEGFEIVKIKESKYWGNIKVILKKNNVKLPVKSKNYKKHNIEKFFIKKTHWFYRFILKNFNINANN